MREIWIWKMDALFPMNVFFADLRDIGSGEDGEGWVCLGVAILIVGYFTYDGIICSKWWKNRGKTKE